MTESSLKSLIKKFCELQLHVEFLGDNEIIEEVIKLGPTSPLMENDLFKI